MTVRLDGRGTPEDDAARVRAAISDVRPASFRNLIDRRLQESVIAAGRLTRFAAQVPNRDTQPEAIDRRVVGVQLIYEGLKLIRALARSPPWEDEPASDADIEILVANVLVARGFSLLAQTEASSAAVEVIRAFGREETTRHTKRSERDRPDRALEASVFELGIVAGVTATGAARPTESHAFATEIARSLDDGFEDGQFQLSESMIEELHELVPDAD